MSKTRRKLKPYSPGLGWLILGEAVIWAAIGLAGWMGWGWRGTVIAVGMLWLALQIPNARKRHRPFDSS